MIGIFLVVENEILLDAVADSEGPSFGALRQHGEHYAFWEQCIRKRTAESLFKSHAYDFYPRGRIVFDPSRNTHILYVDRCIPTAIRALIVERFALTRHVVRGDHHYRCAGCQRLSLDDDPNDPGPEIDRPVSHAPMSGVMASADAMIPAPLIAKRCAVGADTLDRLQSRSNTRTWPPLAWPRPCHECALRRARLSPGQHGKPAQNGRHAYAIGGRRTLAEPPPRAQDTK